MLSRKCASRIFHHISSDEKITLLTEIMNDMNTYDLGRLLSHYARMPHCLVCNHVICAKIGCIYGDFYKDSTIEQVYICIKCKDTVRCCKCNRFIENGFISSINHYEDEYYILCSTTCSHSYDLSIYDSNDVSSFEDY